MKKTLGTRVCNGPLCTRIAQAGGLCASHMWQQSRSGCLTPIRERVALKPCAGPECDREAYAKGFCSAHYQQSRKGKTLSKLTKQSSRWVTDDGYIMIGSISEHRLVMEAFLGRKLATDETVHHKNGVRHDNQLKNLELRVGAHPRGITIEDAVAWAVDILERHNPSLLA